MGNLPALNANATNGHHITPNGLHWTCTRCHHVARNPSEYSRTPCTVAAQQGSPPAVASSSEGSSQEPDEITEADRIIEQTFDFWINPEIERRRQAGPLPEGFTLYAAQIIWNVDARGPEVRFNQEVRAVLRARATRAVTPGEDVTTSISNVDDVVDIDLTGLDPNAAHETLVRRGGYWWIKYDFRYNATRVAAHIDVARQFLDAATSSRDKGHLHAFVENLFAAAELMAKGLLLMLPDKHLLTTKTHRFIRGQYNQWGKLGNTDPRFVRLLNRTETHSAG